MANLFNISEELYSLLEEIEENDGIIEEEEQLKKLDILTKDLDNSLRAYHYVIVEKQGEIASIDAEIERLTKLKTVKTNLINRLKTSIRNAVLAFGETGKSGNKIYDLGDIKFYTKKNEVVQLDSDFYVGDYMKYKLNENLTVEEYNKLVALLERSSDIKYSIAPNKIDIKKDLKNGVEIRGASLVRNDSIVIK